MIKVEMNFTTDAFEVTWKDGTQQTYKIYAIEFYQINQEHNLVVLMGHEKLIVVQDKQVLIDTLTR